VYGVLWFNRILIQWYEVMDDPELVCIFLRQKLSFSTSIAAASNDDTHIFYFRENLGCKLSFLLNVSCLFLLFGFSTRDQIYRMLDEVRQLYVTKPVSKTVPPCI
jgi:hypothetical protein